MPALPWSLLMPDRDPVLDPYLRISDPTQRKGGGLDRQQKADLATFCRMYGFTLSGEVFEDDGVSAFEGLNASPDHELGRYLALVQRGGRRPGDCLLLENYDRLSRQNPWEAVGLVRDLRRLKIHVGRLDRMKLLRYDEEDTGDFFEAACEFVRGNGESRAKSFRNGERWASKRQAAREGRTQPPSTKVPPGRKAITRMLPAWIVLDPDHVMVLHPERAPVVRLIYDLAAAGHSPYSIVGELTRREVPPFTGQGLALGEGGAPVLHKKGRRLGKPRLCAVPGLAFGAGVWTEPYVRSILRDRKTVGEFQPRTRRRQPDGPPVPGYYPACVTEDQWAAAQAGQAARRMGPSPLRGTRLGKRVNLFAGLLRHGRDGDEYVYGRKKKGGHPTLICRSAREGRGVPQYGFPAHLFEDAVISAIREIDPRVILGSEGPDPMQVLDGREQALLKAIAAIEADLEKFGESETQSRRLREKEADLREVRTLQAEALRSAASPLSEALSQVQSLHGALDDRDRRVRYRAALRRIVESVWLLVVPVANGGRDRVCVCQIHFTRGARRTYYFRYNAAGNNRPGGLVGRPLSFPEALPGGRDDFDLRDPAHAREVEAMIHGQEMGPSPARSR